MLRDNMHGQWMDTIAYHLAKSCFQNQTVQMLYEKNTHTFEYIKKY